MRLDFLKDINASINKNDYDDYADSVAEHNLKSMTIIAFVGTIVCFILLIDCFLPFSSLTVWPAYVSMLILFAVFFAVSRTALKKNSEYVLISFYIMLVLLLGGGIVLSTFLTKNINATAYIMLIVVIPMIIVDRPVRLNVVLGAMSLVFCFVTIMIKEKYLYITDITNCIVFYIVGVTVGNQNIRAKMADIKLQGKLRRQSGTDVLTGLSNRRYFESSVSDYIRDNKDTAVLIVADIDDFKIFNDTFGHEYGDRVLQGVSDCFRTCFRSSDYTCRFGGDEFVAFLPFVNNMEIVQKRVAILLSMIENIEIVKGINSNISISVGLAIYPQNGADFEVLFQNADSALYDAKRRGKGCYELCSH